jgi:putative (di)nucleoside polyphosphate hydrolase
MAINHGGLAWIGRRKGIEGVPGATGSSGWQMPQGGIDDDEEPRAAAIRELAEETGMRSVEIIAETQRWHTYDLPAELARKAWQGRWRGQRQKWFVMRFHGDENEIDIGAKPGHKQEFDAWRWAPLDEIEQLIVPFKRRVYAAVIAELRPLVLPG